MSEIIKTRWLVDHEQTKIAPKTLSSQVINDDGTLFKDTVNESLNNLEDTVNESLTNLEDTVNESLTNLEEKVATKEYVEALYMKLNSNTVLGFYCVEDVTIITNGISKVYPANSNVEIAFIEGDTFEIVPTSDNSILSLSAFPGALNTYYSWLEGVKQFSNILFDMNNEDMYTKWSQGNQGAYQVQFAQYNNCVFWSDNPYISDVAKRTNYTLCSTSQLPLCYSTIPDNTFKSFYLAFGVNSDPNWSNPAYKDSFAKATWATQAFSYYGARIVGFPGHDSPNFTITLPKDCRGLMFDARNIECAGTFDAVNTTNFGAKSGSWREAFGDCPSLRRLYIKNLKVNLNISWSPIDYDSIYYIISAAANTNAITISVSPYTYNLLSQSDFDLAASKNITIALLSTNYVEDKRLSAITNHTHDDIYYTEVEIDTKLASKSDTTHRHDDEYDAKGAASSALDSAKVYADSAANAVKDDLLNGAGDAYDTLKELGDLIDENVDAIDALEIVASNKADKEHTHDIYETKEDAQTKYDTITDAKADWSQSNANAIDYVKNRTHYVDTPVTVTELNMSGASFRDVLHEEFTLYHLTDKVFVSPEELYGLYIMGYSRPLCYIGAGGNCKWYDYDYSTSILSYTEVPYVIVDVADDSGVVVGFNILIDENERGMYRYGICCIHKDGVLNETQISAGTYLEFTTHSSPMLMVALTTGYEEVIHQLDEKFIPDTIARKSEVDNTVSSLQSSINDKAEKATTLSGYGITDAYTKIQVDTALSGKADSSHGNHVPEIQPASDKVFLRNDNTWATVTPANIGAAESGHTHTASEVGAYSKEEINNLELITVADIDAICNASIMPASEVTY